MAGFISDSIQVHIVKFNLSNLPEYLVIKRSESNELYPSMWQVITGWIEDGETAIQTAIREVKEEVGLSPTKIWTIPYVAIFFNPLRDFIQFAPVFGMLVDNKSEVQLSNEHSEFQWLNYQACLQTLEFPSHRYGIEIFHNYVISSNNCDKYLFKI